MPDRKNRIASARPAAKTGGRQASFRQRYDDLEHRRRLLIARLDAMGTHGRAHPAFRKVLTLLNRSFRKADIVQRAAVLQAADWLISLIEFGSTIV
jgi:hypothetical protein